MLYNFDQIVDRIPFNSSKWNMNTRPYQKGDLLPLWVADSDLTSPEPVKAAIKAFAEHGFFGYTTAAEQGRCTASGGLASGRD